MGSRLTEIVVDSRDPAAQAAFWAAALSYHVVRTEAGQVEIAAWEGERRDLAEQVRQAPVVPVLVFVTLTPTNDGQTGSAAVTIGLAKPRTVTPAATGEWAGEGRTLRLIDHGAFLEVSCYGAQRIRFDRVNGAAPPTQRGLTAP